MLALPKERDKIVLVCFSKTENKYLFLPNLDEKFWDGDIILVILIAE